MQTFYPRPALRWLALAVAGLAAVCSPAPAAPVQMPGYEIVYLGRGHLNRLLMTVTIEGKKGIFVVDTGASGSLASADKYGFLRPGADRQLPAGVPKTANVNGVTVPVGYARDFQVKNTNLGALALRVVPPRYLYDPQMLYQTDKNADHDGFLGEDILRHCNAILDAGRLILYLNVEPGRKTDPGRGLVAAGWTRVPMADAHNDFTVECQLGGAKFRLFVDTGAPFLVLDKRATQRARAQGYDVPMRGGVVGTRQRNSSLVVTDQFTVGDYAASQVQIVSQEGLADSMRSDFNASVPIAGLLGGDFLAKNNAIIDIGNKALYLKRPSAGTAKKP